MIRFRVIKGSQLLLGVAAVLLALVILILAVRYAVTGDSGDVPASANLVQLESEAEAAWAVSPSGSGAPMPVEILVLPSEQGENEHTDDVVEAPEVEILPNDAPEAIQPSGSVRVLIYHTHTHEAYEQTAEDPYVAIEAWRTEDADHSVVRVGRELARLLTDRGFTVVHDETDFEQNDHNTAYTRSLAALESYPEPFDLYIDLHRDGYVEGMRDLTVAANEADYAKLMLLIGNGENFSEKPYYAENYLLAQRLTDRLNTFLPGICRDVMVKNGRYNQHIGVFSILVEAGNNKNTLEQAVRSMTPLADALESLLILQPDEEIAHLTGRN